MQRILSWLLPGCLALAAVTASAQAKNQPISVGSKVPEFSVTDLSGKVRTLSELRKSAKSGTVSLTFWCSFCHSCRHVEKDLDDYARRHKDEVTVAAVDASAGETAAAVAEFAKKTGLSIPIYMDGKGRLADLFGVGVTTTTVVIDREGILRYRGQYAHGKERYAENALQAVLKGKDVPRTETPLLG